MANDNALEFQFNVTNLLDEEYYGTISSGVGRTSTTPLPCYRANAPGVIVNCVGPATAANPAGNNINGGVGFFSIGAPRTYVISVNYKF
jgi:outer membrane receptor protein involved in Fe transport